MSSSDLQSDVPIDLNSAIFDRLTSDGIKVKCVNSSDFVVGNQTNFNAPVTIINCNNATSSRDECSPSYLNSSSEQRKKEEIVIRDKILSESASATLKKMAAGGAMLLSGFKNSKLFFLLEFGLSFQVPNFVWIGCFVVLIGTTIALAFVVKAPETSVKEIIRCHSYTKPNGKSICVYRDWENQKKAEFKLMNTPVPYVVISETNSNICFDYETCIEAIEMFQSSTWENEGNDASANFTVCNFFVGGDGSIYEDAGWNGTNTVSGLAAGKSIDVCLLSNSVDYPTFPQIESATNLISFGLLNNLIAKNYVLMVLNATSSNVYNIVKKWPHFSEFPFSVDEADIFGEDYPIVSKEDWGGLPATSFIEMKLPVPYVVISHSVTVTCSDRDACSVLLQGIQKYHQSIRFADIAYNFMVDSNGVIYEGRGWSWRNVAGGFINGRNIDINLIGDFSKAAIPTNKQLNGVKYLIRKGVKTGKIALDYVLISANATFSTLSPGINVYSVIKNWPHFDPEPESHLIESF